MKECELCKYPARLFCESDQASLCWDCDGKVHSANFLVARHSRSLLCHVCQFSTPWKASGAKVGPTVSVCVRCVEKFDGRQQNGEEMVEESERGNDVEFDGENDGDDEDEDEDDVDVDDDDDDDDDEDEDESEGDDDDEEEEEDGENQVVPWSSTPPPPVASSSSSEESSSKFSNSERGIADSTISFSLKRMRDFADLGYQTDLASSSSQPKYNTAVAAPVPAVKARTSVDDEVSSFNSFRPSKDRKRKLTIRSPESQAETDLRSAAIVGSLTRLQKDVISGDDTSASTILDICKLCKDPSR